MQALNIALLLAQANTQTSDYTAAQIRCSIAACVLWV